MTRNYPFHRAALSLLLLASTASAQSTVPPPTTSYSCSAPENAQCGQNSDRFYEINAVYGKYFVENYPVGNFGDPDAGGAYLRLRSFEGGRGFADDEKATDSPLGPNLKVSPGEVMSVLVRNNIQPGTPPSSLGDGGTDVSVLKARYMAAMNASNPEGSMYSMQDYGFEFQGPAPASIDDITVPNPENIPYKFDGFNLHLHGMVVEPHLFYPQGTSDTTADWIDVEPGECYCYNFYIPSDHPTGTYWWHTHRHGSTAMWTWAQGAGLVEVEGSLQWELESQNVTEQMSFVVTDPHLTYSAVETNTYVVSPFLVNQNDVQMNDLDYHVNGMYQPTFEMKPNETKWVRFLTATTENLLNFHIVNNATGEIVNVWDIASDGINYEQPVQKEQFVHGGGMRQDLLLQFPEEGFYEVWSTGLSDVQFYGTGPDDQKLATFQVVGNHNQEPVDISSMEFSLPLANLQNISDSDVTIKRRVEFHVGGNTSVVPFPQFTINEKAFNLDDIIYNLTMDGHAEEWELVSNSNATHPFHIHVVPFQVKNSTTENINPTYDLFTAINPIDTWRDVVLIPPYGTVTIRILFKPSADVDLNGKSVFHCHFLAHEDTGMIQPIKFLDPTEPVLEDDSSDGETVDSSGRSSRDIDWTMHLLQLVTGFFMLSHNLLW